MLHLLLKHIFFSVKIVSIVEILYNTHRKYKKKNYQTRFHKKETFSSKSLEYLNIMRYT